MKCLSSIQKKQQAKGNGFKFEPTDGNCVGKAITTRAGARTDDNFIKEQCAGVMLGTSERFNAGLCEQMSRSITTEGKNGVVEWGGADGVLLGKSPELSKRTVKRHSESNND